MIRRGAVLATVLAVMLLGIGMPSVAAQQATPAAAMFPDTMGLPELRVRVTDTAFEGVPAETPAGRYLLTVDVEAADGGGVGFMQLPEGMSADDFMTMLAGGPMGSPEPSMATPAMEASPAAGEERPPDWVYQTKFAGGTGALSGTAQAIIDLTPGNWIAWADDPEAPQPPVPVTVTGETGATPAAAAEPTADSTITLFEYGFKVDGALKAGQQVIKVTNVGAQPHFLYAIKSPEPVTKEQVGQILQLEATGATPSPDSGLPDPDAFVPVAYMATLSMGSTAWLAANLEPGTYVLLCFFPDIESGMPHAFEGMYEVVTIGGEATPTT